MSLVEQAQRRRDEEQLRDMRSTDFKAPLTRVKCSRGCGRDLKPRDNSLCKWCRRIEELRAEPLPFVPKSRRPWGAAFDLDRIYWEQARK